MVFRYSNRGEGENFTAWLDRIINYMTGNSVDKSKIERVANLEYVACYIESLCMGNPYHDLIINVNCGDTLIDFVFPIDRLDYNRAVALSEQDDTKSISQWLWQLLHEQVEQRYNFFEFAPTMVYRRCKANNFVRCAWVKDIKR